MGVEGNIWRGGMGTGTVQIIPVSPRTKEHKEVTSVRGEWHQEKNQ